MSNEEKLLKNFISTQTSVMVLGFAVISAVGLYLANSFSVLPKDVYRKVEEVHQAIQVLELENTEAQLIYKVLDDSGSAIVSLDNNGIVTSWSKGAEVLFGVSRVDAVGYGIAHIIPNGMRKEHHEHFSNKMSEPGEPFQRTIECEAQYRDGTPLLVRINIWGIPDKKAIAVFTKLEKQDDY